MNYKCKTSLVAFLSFLLSSCTLSGSIVEKIQNPEPVINPNGLNILTKSYNSRRTGANTREAILNQQNVNSEQFGKIGELSVDDDIFAGLLYVSDFFLNGKMRNVLFAATVNNTVYAFDADELGKPIWERNFNKEFDSTGRPSGTSDINLNGNVNYPGNVGIVGTPVIDSSSNTMYFVTRTEEGDVVAQRLWAIDITNGKNRIDSIKIASTEFLSRHNNQRPALALGNNTVYVAWASFGDAAPYHGIVKGFDSNTFALTGTFNSTASGSLGGIWMASGAPAMDTEGNLYYTTGNGSWDGKTNFGNSMVKLKARTLDVLDWFTPHNWELLNYGDLDFGSSFPMILPGLDLIVTGSKGQEIYLLNANNLGKIAESDTQIPQKWNAQGHMHHGLASWQGPDGVRLFTWNEHDYLRSFRFNNSTNNFDLPSIGISSVKAADGMPGATMSISSDGNKSGTGIVWAAIPLDQAITLSVPGKLLAFSAEEKNGELPLLWTSDSTKDDMHDFSKGSPPIVINGKVYVASLSNIISVYGLKNN